MKGLGLVATRAFDAHAQHYDEIVEPNVLLQGMREALWREVQRRVPAPGRLLDVGCGTGIDAEHFAQLGYRVTATDASGEMVTRTQKRLSQKGALERVEALELGAHELDGLAGKPFDAIYSDLGPLNCVPDLRGFARICAAHVKPYGYLILSVMGRVCPWEILYFALRGEPEEAKRRFPRELVAVKLEDDVVWTRYYAPREFFGFFAEYFELVTYHALNVVLPPPYLIRWYKRAGMLAGAAAWIDSRAAGLPMVRDMGDHFLMTLRKRG